MRRPLFRIEEEKGETNCVYHFFARFIVEEHLLSLVKDIAGIKGVWQDMEENHFAVSVDTTFDTEIMMLRLKAALARYVKENRLDRL